MVAATGPATDYRIEALGPHTWGAFAQLAERHNGVWGGCWCVWFHPDSPERKELGNRGYKQRLVEQGRAHAALVFDGDTAVAWCEYGSVEELPNIYHRKQVEAESERTPDYPITCLGHFRRAPRHRGRLQDGRCRDRGRRGVVPRRSWPFWCRPPPAPMRGP